MKNKVFYMLMVIMAICFYTILKQDYTIRSLTQNVNNLEMQVLAMGSVTTQKQIAEVAPVVIGQPIVKKSLVQKSTIKNEPYFIKANDEWSNFTNALIKTESNGYANAVGDGGKAIGVLQLTKIYVDEVNRLQGYAKWNYDDRYDPDKSISIFNEMQAFKNPQKCHFKALSLHNPRAGSKYKEIVFAAAERFKISNMT